jgi:lipopolysaccharide/colanic/teichoic acid biosynthesis glycosyltransferase
VAGDGRADLSYDERVTLDMYYIRNYSIWLDVRLLFETVGAVLRGSGAY